jgi:hypothetical protein
LLLFRGVKTNEMMNMKRPCRSWGRAFWFQAFHSLGLAGDYVGRTRAFFALSDLEFHLLAFVERCIARRLNFRVVDEQIFAAIIGVNKAKSLA